MKHLVDMCCVIWMGNAPQTPVFEHCPQHVLDAAVLGTCWTFDRWSLNGGSGSLGVGLEDFSPAQLPVSLCTDVRRNISHNSPILATNSTPCLPRHSGPSETVNQNNSFPGPEQGLSR